MLSIIFSSFKRKNLNLPAKNFSFDDLTFLGLFSFQFLCRLANGSNSRFLPWFLHLFSIIGGFLTWYWSVMATIFYYLMCLRIVPSLSFSIHLTLSLKNGGFSSDGETTKSRNQWIVEGVLGQIQRIQVAWHPVNRRQKRIILESKASLSAKVKSKFMLNHLTVMRV